MWDDFARQLANLRQLDRERQLIAFEVDGVSLVTQSGQRLINFGSNDYLGLSRWASNRVASMHAVGATASPLVCGWTDRHQRLADLIADFEGTQSAVVFASGFAACSGTVAALAGERDLILSDQLNHASLIDGCRLSKARCIVFPHRDYDAVRSILGDQRSRFARVWIVTDGVFSMDGHIAPLDQLSRIAEHWDAQLIVDEAHATGVLGESGSGVCEALAVKDEVAIRIGTLSKALGGQGGFVACPTVVADHLINHCRTLIYSTALSIPAVETAITVLTAGEEMRRRRQRVCGHARRVRSALHLDSDLFEADVPIIPVRVGSDSAVVCAANRLRQRGLYVPAIRPPTVPQGTARLRVSLSADHTDEMIDRLVSELSLL